MIGLLIILNYSDTPPVNARIERERVREIYHAGEIPSNIMKIEQLQTSNYIYIPTTQT